MNPFGCSGAATTAADPCAAMDIAAPPSVIGPAGVSSSLPSSGAEGDV